MRNPHTSRNGTAISTPGKVAQKSVVVKSVLKPGQASSGRVYGAIATR